MLSILFQVGAGRYALEIGHVVEVVPRIPLRSLPQTPSYIAGVFDYGRAIVPVVDLRLLFEGRPCDELLSTRLIVVSLNAPGASHQRLLGLVAERVSDIKVLGSTTATAVSGAQRSYLGRVVKVDGELVQIVHVDSLLPAEVGEQLYEITLGAG